MLARQTVETGCWGRVGRNPPARSRRVRFARCVFLRHVVPTPDDQRRNAAFTGAQLQAARGIQRQTRDFADYAREAPALEAFFHRGQHVTVFPGLTEDYAVRMQTDACKGWRKEITPAQTPQHRSLHTRENAREIQSGEASILAGRSAFAGFMQMTAQQTAVRQPFIDRGEPKRQYFALLTPMPFDALQIAAQLGNRSLRAGERHPRVLLGVNQCSYFVLFMLGVNADRKTCGFIGLLRVADAHRA